MKTRLWNNTLLLGFLLLLCVPAVYAQPNGWDVENGLAVRQGDHIAIGKNSVADDGLGNFLVAWSAASKGSMDVYAQLYNFAGEPQWGEEGISVAQTAYPDQDGKVVRTSDGNWIIAWMDFVNTMQEHGVGEIYMQKYDYNGNPLWTEPVGPVGRCVSYAYKWKMMADPSGGVIVATNHNYEIYLQRIHADGSIAWDQPINIHNPGYFELHVVIAPDGSVVVVPDYRLTTDQDFIAHKISLDGERLWPGGEDGYVLVEADEVSTRKPLEPVVLSNGDVVVMWEENPASQVKGVKISPEGTMLWGDVPATILESFVRTERNTSTLLPGDRILIADGTSDLTLNKIDCSGNQPELEWKSTSIPVQELVESSFDLLPNGDIWVSWVDWDDLYARRINSAGEWKWDNALNLGHWEGLFHYGIVQYQDAVATLWNCQINGLTGIGFRKHDVETGSSVSDSPVLIESGVSGYTMNPKLLRSRDVIYTTWFETRSSHGEAVPYLQILDYESGDVRLAKNGVPLVAPESVYRSILDLSIIADQEYGAYIFWIERDIGGDQPSRVRGQHIDHQGNLLWGDDGLTVIQSEERGDYGILEYQLTHTESGHFVVSALVTGQQTRYKAQPCYVNFSNGAIIPEFPLYSSGNNNYDFENLLILPAGGDDLIFAAIVQSETNGPESVLYARVQRDGLVPWTRTIDPSTNLVDLNSVRLEESGDIVTVMKVLDDEFKLRTQRITVDGNWVGEPSGTTIHEDSNIYDGQMRIDPRSGDISLACGSNGIVMYYHFTYDGTSYVEDAGGRIVARNSSVNNMILDPDGGAYLFFSKFDELTDEDIYFNHVESDGEFYSEEYSEAGKPLVNALFRQYSNDVIPDSESGFIAVWNDYRGSYASEPEDDVYIARYVERLNGVQNRGTSTQPLAFNLAPPYPNPFNSSTSIQFTIPYAENVRLSVYDILGREVVCLADRHMEAGYHIIHWNGANIGRKIVASGAYIVELQSGQQKSARKVLLLK